MESIAERLQAVRELIARSARAVGRDPAGIRLIAVSKTRTAAEVRAAYAAGQREFGENYVQELVAKAAALADLGDLGFHMIGHLQRNKVKQVVRAASMVHTVHSVELARELGKRTVSHPEPGAMPGDGYRLPVLIEVNVGREAQKSGCAPEDLGPVLLAVEAEPTLRLAGLMTVPPHTEDPAGAVPFFDRLRALRDAFGGPSRLPELSMGMTHDLEYAVAAGATIVRVGTAIFGERDTGAG